MSFRAASELMLSAMHGTMKFNRRRRENGMIDSVCSLCLQKVASAKTEAELRQDELFHHCEVD